MHPEIKNINSFEKYEKNQLEHENSKTCEAFDSKLNKLKEFFGYKTFPKFLRFYNSSGFTVAAWWLQAT